MSTPSFLREWPDSGPALAISGIHLAMALNLAWVGLVLGNSGLRLLFGLGAHESVRETTTDQRSTVVHQTPDARAPDAKRRLTRLLAQRFRQLARR